MRAMRTFLILAGVLFITASSASPEGKPVTPYGDFCTRCGHYGACKSEMSLEDAENAIAEYYHNKGFRINVEEGKGRFIRANINRGDETVDVIIFDRETGRIRSIY